MSTTTSPHPAPIWATADTRVDHERGDRVHPDDAGTTYTRILTSWESTPGDHEQPARLEVTLWGLRPDEAGQVPSDVATVHEGGVPQLTVTAADARTLGQALMTAADLLDGGAQR